MNFISKTLAEIKKYAGVSTSNCRSERSPRIVLRTQATLAIQPCRQTPQEVSCRRGMLWITQEGNGEDIILRQGQRVTLRKRGRVLIQALKASSFSMTDPQGNG